MKIIVNKHEADLCAKIKSDESKFQDQKNRKLKLIGSDIICDERGLEIFEREMIEKKVIDYNLAVIKTTHQPNIMIVLGVILIIADGDFFSMSFVDKSGKKKKTTRKLIVSACMKRYHVPDNKMMRSREKNCMIEARCYLKSLRDYENRKLKYFERK